MDTISLCALGAPSAVVTNAVNASRVEFEDFVNFDLLGPNLTIFFSALNQIAVNLGGAGLTLRHSLVEGDTAGSILASLPAPNAGTGGVIVGNSTIVAAANPGGQRYVTITSQASVDPVTLSFRGLLAVFTAATVNTCGSTVNTPLVALVTGAQVLADKVNDASVTADTWNGWVNQGVESLWNLVTTAYGDRFFSTFDFALAGGPTGNFVDVTTIPAKDFRSIRLVEYQPDTPNRKHVRSFNFAEKDRTAGTINLGLWDGERRHRLMGNKLFIEKYENAAGNYRLYYVPKVPLLVNKCDTLPDSINQYAEYPMVFAAMKGLNVEESDDSPLATRLAFLKGEIEASAPSRDDTDGDVIADVEGSGYVRGGWT